MVKKQTVKKPTLHTRARRAVKLAVVPHKANQFRPHAVRRYGLGALAIVLVSLFALHNVTTTGDVLGQQAVITSDRLLLATNQAREKDGLSDLRLNQKLTDAAYAKAHDMINNQYWAHQSPTGVQPWKWFSDVQYDYSRAGENLARDFTTPEAVTNAWLASPAHRENVLGQAYQDVGFAVVQGELNGRNATVVVALYGAPVQVGAVAGVDTSFELPTSNTSFVANIGQSFQTLPATAIGSLLIVLVMAGVAVVAHASRHRLPKSLQRTWYRHHGLYKAIGLSSFSVIIVVMYSGGQI